MKVVTKRAEVKLLDITRGLKSDADGYYVLYYHLSRLQEEFGSEYQIKIATNVLSDLFKALDCIVFVSEVNDIVVLYNGTNRALLEKAIFQLRYLFMDDPLAYNDDGFENEDFCTVYDLEFQWADFFVTAKRLAGQDKTKAILSSSTPSSDIETPVGNREKLHLLSPGYLVEVIEELKHIDLSPALRSQPVCALSTNRTPKIVFREVYSNIMHVQRLLSLNVDLMSSRTLFQYLTKELDRRVLGILKDDIEMCNDNVSINLNVKTLFSEEFAAYDALLSKKQKSSIIIEINVANVFEHIHSFILARDEVRSLGYRMCLDGLDDKSFMQIDRDGLGFDLLKLQWHSDMGDESKSKSMELAEAVKRCGANRIILCHCDSSKSIAYGKSIGISLFQGRYLDGLLNPDASVIN